MSEQHGGTPRSFMSSWWMVIASSVVLVAVVVALIVGAINTGGLGESNRTAVAAAAQPTVTARPATPRPTPTASSTPQAPLPPAAGGHLRYTGGTTGSRTFPSSQCIIADGTVAEVYAPTAASGAGGVLLSLSRVDGGLSVLFSQRYLHRGATPGVTVTHTDGAWSVHLHNVTLQGTDGQEVGVTLNGTVNCTYANVPQ